MKRQTVITQKKRGPAPTGKGTLVGVRFQPDDLGAIDVWITRQDKAATRPEAIRTLVGLALAADRPAARTSAKTAARAAELAGKAIDRASDPTVSPDERAVRKRKVLKGPSAFRDMRKD